MFQKNLATFSEALQDIRPSPGAGYRSARDSILRVSQARSNNKVLSRIDNQMKDLLPQSGSAGEERNPPLPRLLGGYQAALIFGSGTVLMMNIIVTIGCCLVSNQIR